MDFILAPTVRFRLLYAWFVIGHRRREIIHFGVTVHPTSPWVIQQLRGAFPDETTPRFLIYDNSDRVHTQLRDSPIGRPTDLRPSSKAQIIGASGRKQPDRAAHLLRKRDRTSLDE